MKEITTIVLVFILGSSYAQKDTLSNEYINGIYHDRINFLKENKTRILTDSTISNKDFKNIITLKTNEFNAILTIKDTTQRKRLINEKIRDLDLFIENSYNEKIVSEYLVSNLSNVKLYYNRIDSINRINGIEGCLTCPIWRKVNFLVLNIRHYKIDTIICAIVNYKKIGFRGTQVSDEKFEAFPCSKEIVLSLNGSYGQNIIEVSFNKKKYRKDFILTEGKSENDIYILPFVLDDKFLVND